jgi:probable HAF family extracellular repeat protein
MRVFASALLLAVAHPPTPAQAQVVYTITDLGSFGNGSSGQGINASGQVTGRSAYPDLPNGQPGAAHAFRTFPGGRISDPGTDLGTLPGGTTSTGRSINAAGQVTGDSTTLIGGALATHAFRTTATGAVGDPGTDLGLIGGPSPGVSIGFAINASGQVAGESSNSLNTVHAFRSSPNGQPVVLNDLGVFAGGSNSVGTGINDAGQVVGYSAYGPTTPFDTFGPTRAFRTTAVGVLTDPGADLGTLGGSQSRAFGINPSGQTVGRSFTTFDAAQHAFRSSPNGQAVILTDLGTLGGTFSEGLAINGLGVVVGDSAYLPGQTFPAHAFIFDTQMRDLNLLIPPGSGWELGSAISINDFGQITGVGSIGGQSHAFLLTPIVIPEPSALALIGLAAGAWLWRRRNLQRASCQLLVVSEDRISLTTNN